MQLPGPRRPPDRRLTLAARAAEQLRLAADARRGRSSGPAPAIESVRAAPRGTVAVVRFRQRLL